MSSDSLHTWIRTLGEPLREFAQQFAECLADILAADRAWLLARIQERDVIVAAQGEKISDLEGRVLLLERLVVHDEKVVGDAT